MSKNQANPTNNKIIFPCVGEITGHSVNYAAAVSLTMETFLAANNRLQIFKVNDDDKMIVPRVQHITVNGVDARCFYFMLPASTDNVTAYFMSYRAITENKNTLNERNNTIRQDTFTTMGTDNRLYHPDKLYKENGIVYFPKSIDDVKDLKDKKEESMATMKCASGWNVYRIVIKSVDTQFKGSLIDRLHFNFYINYTDNENSNKHYRSYVSFMDDMNDEKINRSSSLFAQPTIYEQRIRKYILRILSGNPFWKDYSRYRIDENGKFIKTTTVPKTQYDEDVQVYNENNPSPKYKFTYENGQNFMESDSNYASVSKEEDRILKSSVGNVISNDIIRKYVESCLSAIDLKKDTAKKIADKYKITDDNFIKDFIDIRSSWDLSDSVDKKTKTEDSKKIANKYNISDDKFIDDFIKRLVASVSYISEMKKIAVNIAELFDIDASSINSFIEDFIKYEYLIIGERNYKSAMEAREKIKDFTDRSSELRSKSKQVDGYMKRSDMPIVLPTISFYDEGEKVLVSYPERLVYTKKILEYIVALDSLIDKEKDNLVVGVSQSVNNCFLRFDRKEIGIISQYHSGLRVVTNIYLKDKQMLRLICGSSPVFNSSNSNFMKFVAENSKQSKTSDGKVEKDASYGYGCINNNTMRYLYKIINGGGPGYPKLIDMLKDTAYRNSFINEQIGMTFEDMDNLLFENASQFYSFSGSNESLNDCIAHYCKNPNKDQITMEYYSIIANVFKDFYEQLYDLFNTVEISDLKNKAIRISSFQEKIPLEATDKERKNFIRILLRGIEYYGYVTRDKGMPAPEYQTLKIAYQTDTPGKIYPVATPNPDNTIKPYKYADGGTNFQYSFKKVTKSISEENEYISNIITKYPSENHRPDPRSNADHLCHYGYTAKNLTLISQLIGGHLDYFIPSKTEFNMIPGESNLSSVKTYIPGMTFPVLIFGANSNELMTKGPLSKHIVYTDPANTSSELSNLKNLKSNWIGYTTTSDFYTRLADFSNNRREEMLKSVSFAKKLSNNNKLSIFSIMPFMKTITQKEENEGYFNLFKQWGATVIDNIKKISNGRETVFQYLSIENNKTVMYEFLRATDRGNSYDVEALPITNIDIMRRIQSKFYERAAEKIKDFSRNLYRNFILHCDADFRAHRILILFNHITETQQVTDITPLDIINGYLLRTDFNRVGDSGDLSNSAMKHFNYLALSASMYYEKNPVTNHGKIDVFKEKGLDIHTSVENDKFTKEFHKTGSMATRVMYANIADVPLYTLIEKGNNMINIFMKTMNGCFSPATTAFYYFSRAIRSSDKSGKYSHTFNPLSGVPYTSDLDKRSKINLDERNLMNMYMKKNEEGIVRLYTDSIGSGNKNWSALNIINTGVPIKNTKIEEIDFFDKLRADFYHASREFREKSKKRVEDDIAKIGTTKNDKKIEDLEDEKEKLENNNYVPKAIRGQLLMSTALYTDRSVLNRIPINQKQRDKGMDITNITRALTMTFSYTDMTIKEKGIEYNTSRIAQNIIKLFQNEVSDGKWT